MEGEVEYMGREVDYNYGGEVEYMGREVDYNYGGRGRVYGERGRL